MPFAGLTHVSSKSHVLDWVKIGRIQSPPRGVTRQRCSLSSKFFYHLLYFITFAKEVIIIIVIIIIFYYAMKGSKEIHTYTLTMNTND